MQVDRVTCKSWLVKLPEVGSVNRFETMRGFSGVREHVNAICLDLCNDCCDRRGTQLNVQGDVTHEKALFGSGPFDKKLSELRRLSNGR